MFQKEYYQKQKYQGDWKCSKCGAEIRELPFEPSENRPIYCNQCHRENLQKLDERKIS